MQQLLTNSELTLNKRIWGHKDLLTSSPLSRPIYCNIAVGKAGEPEMQIERRQDQYRQSWLRRISSPGQRRMRLPSFSGHPICADLVSVGEDVHCESTAQEVHA